MEYNIDLKIRIKIEKKLNIGSAYAIKTKADIPIQKILIGKKHYLYIPGTTLKGVLRTSLIKSANLLGYKVNYHIDPNELISSDDIVTRLFGAPHDKYSKVYVDPILIDNIETQVLTHISIDDKIGIVKEGSLFTVEYIPPGIEIETYIRGRKLSIEEARALFMSILELNYERIGKAGLINVRIIESDSNVPEEIIKDDIIKTIWEGIKLWVYIW